LRCKTIGVVSFHFASFISSKSFSEAAMKNFSLP
jgi:hypothetical protein